MPPNLILLPGLDGTGELFEPLLAALPADVRPQVVRYPPDAVQPLPDYAKIVSSNFPAGGTVLLAESFSSLVALTFLMRHPGRVAAVIFSGGFAEPPRPFALRLAPLARFSGPLAKTIPAFILRQFCLGPAASAQQLAWLRDALAQLTPAVIAHRLQLVATRHSFLNNQYTVPCHYLQAEDDRLVPAGATRWFERHFASFELQRIPGPHLLLQTQPQAAAARIADVVRKYV